MRNLLRTIAGLAFVTAVLLPTGCSPSSTTASGKVTYQGKPVVWGSVTLVAADGSVHQAGIEPDGTYTVSNVPVGSVKVGVESSAPPVPGVRGRDGDARGSVPPPAPPPGAWFPLPANLSDPAKSGLTIEIRKGQPANIDVK
jgi:hypothetical protein